MAQTSEDTADVAIFKNQRFILVGLAALNLQISVRQIKELSMARQFQNDRHELRTTQNNGTLDAFPKGPKRQSRFWRDRFSG
jgi:hypothetical protein